jgi:hypothetical protein
MGRRDCMDYKKINSMTVKAKYPISIIDDLLDKLYVSSYFFKIDLRSGYHQVRMNINDIPKITFITHEGHYEYSLILFSLINDSKTFQAKI